MSTTTSNASDSGSNKKKNTNVSKKNPKKEKVDENVAHFKNIN
jgi:hypothetical protein